MSEERSVLVASAAGIAIRSHGDVTDVIGVCFGAEGLIITENDSAPAFFDLRTDLAGEMFQKFTNYGLRLAVVLPDPEVYGERFGELAYEHRNHPLIRFVHSEVEARAWLQA